MTPAAHWSPDDYYRASRAAFRAWVDSEYRAWIDGVLEAADAGTPFLWGASAASSAPPAAASAVLPIRGALELTPNGKELT